MDSLDFSVPYHNSLIYQHLQARLLMMVLLVHYYNIYHHLFLLNILAY
uniref:Uncharacterized protein n=1 Tax=Cliftonaea pectinata TaxID=2007206 RepID=A0A1Z1MQ36_9FLOR|nr:hypothetical protein [Cliftonaea pectinata]ARW68168.1 hypothetical protein [Cliftonaea pectinata]